MVAGKRAKGIRLYISPATRLSAGVFTEFQRYREKTSYFPAEAFSMSDAQDIPTLRGNQFGFRGFGRYSTDDDFISESPPVQALKQPVAVAPRKKKFHQLQEEIHRDIAPLAVEEETTNLMQPQGVASMSSRGREGNNGSISVEDWIRGLDLQGGKHRYLDHHGSLQRQEANLVNDFQNALGEQRMQRRGSISMPSSPHTSPRLQRRPLPRRASSNDLGETGDYLGKSLEVALGAVANGHPGTTAGEGDSSKSTPRAELVPRCQASELAPSTSQPTSLASRLAQFGPQGGKVAEAPKAEEGVKIPPPPGPSVAKGPFSMGFGRWLFTEKKNVQERDVNVFSPSTY